MADGVMGLFAKLVGGSGPTDTSASPDPATAAPPLAVASTNPNRRTRRRTGRTEVYGVRVRPQFKEEMIDLQAKLQLERRNLHSRPRKVTEGEVIELVFDAFMAMRRNGDAPTNAIPLANDVWQGVFEIARHLQISPAEVVERLVVEKVAELGILPRREA